jgi:glycosyltransferase involved in cell wall biosynthesis
MTPRVSVVVPTHHRPDRVGRTIESILAQTVADLEVVVVDDGPSEPTAQLVENHPDPRVRLVRHERNRGVAAARNSGIAAATAPVLAFLDDDDLWLPAKLERQLPLLDAGAEVVHSLVQVANGDGVVHDAPTERGYRLFRDVAQRGYPYHLLLRRSCYFLNTFLVRRECVDAIGGFDEELTGVEDLDFVHRLWRRYELHLVDEPLVVYCMHANSMGGTKPAEPWRRFARSELAWLAAADPPDWREAEAFLQRQFALCSWIDGRPREGVRPTLRALRLDRSVIPSRTAAKYLVGALLPSALLRRSRESARRVRTDRTPDPWIDL